MKHTKTDMVPYEKWRKDTGVCRSTAWQWRKKGWIKTFRIGGMVYVTAAEVAKFMAAAQAGNFASDRYSPPSC